MRKLDGEEACEALDKVTVVGAVGFEGLRVGVA